MKTAIVILNWNTKEQLERFLPSVLLSASCSPDGTPLGDSEVIVADNGSTDGSLDLMAGLFPGVRVIALDRNYGFTGGYNRALAMLEGYTYYLLLNSDLEVPHGWLEPLEQWMDSHPGCAVCGPKLHALSDRDRFEYAGAAGGFIDRYGYPFCRGRVLKMTEKDKGQYDSAPKDVLWVTGACLMIRASLWKGLDSRFFAHQEEIDLCWRLQLEGYKITVIPQSTVYHLGGGTLPPDSPGKLKLNFRNNLLLLSNNLGKTYALELYREGIPAARAAGKGLRRAKRMIFKRMVLDGGSALVYLMTLRPSFFSAVVKAHKEYKQMVSMPDLRDIVRYLEQYGKSASVSGLYRGFIVAEGAIKGKKIFKSLNI